MLPCLLVPSLEVHEPLTFIGTCIVLSGVVICWVDSFLTDKHKLM